MRNRRIELLIKKEITKNIQYYIRTNEGIREVSDSKHKTILSYQTQEVNWRKNL